MQPGSDCYLLTGKDVLMPGHFVGPIYRDGAELYEVASPDGIIYSAIPANVFCKAEGDAMLRQRRAERLADEGYFIQRLRGDRFRVWCPERHGAAGGYLVMLGEHPACTCPDCAEHGHQCKHILAVPDLLRRAQVEKPTIRIAAIVTPVRPKITRIMIEGSADRIEERAALLRAARLAAV